MTSWDTVPRTFGELRGGAPPVDVPLELPGPFGNSYLHEPLNPALRGVVYPCGAAFDNNEWLVSYGINDEYCAMAQVPQEDVLGAMAPRPLR